MTNRIGKTPISWFRFLLDTQLAEQREIEEMIDRQVASLSERIDQRRAEMREERRRLRSNKIPPNTTGGE